MGDEEQSPAGGPMDGARDALKSFWSLLESRLELAAVEFQEQRNRLLVQFAWLAGGAVLGLMALFAGTFLLIALTWETAARNWVIAGLALAYSGGATWCLVRLKRMIAASPPPFASTIEEFRKDREWFRRTN
jgi:uncharacterized membrane protein YqjE